MAKRVRTVVSGFGDLDPIGYGGGFIFDYGEGRFQAELMECHYEDDPNRVYVYRYDLDQCSYENGVLSDNPFHPDHAAWWAKSIDAMAENVGMEPAELIRLFCSPDPMERSEAYWTIAQYHGPDELDPYPLELTAAEARRRYRSAMATLKRRRSAKAS